MLRCDASVWHEVRFFGHCVRRVRPASLWIVYIVKRNMMRRSCLANHVGCMLLIGTISVGCDPSGNVDLPPKPLGIGGGAERRGLVAVAEGAAAEPPTQCKDEKLEKAFHRGWEAGKRRVAQVWSDFGECGQVDEFVERVIERIQDLVPDREKDKARKRCRYVGMLEGVLDELDVIQQGCVTECFLDGDVVGAIEAKTYCDLIIEAAGELDPAAWIRMPVGTCGVAFEVGCDAQFLATTRAYQNEFGACLPYTTEPYFEIWDVSRLQSCDYQQQSDSGGTPQVHSDVYRSQVDSSVSRLPE